MIDGRWCSTSPPAISIPASRSPPPAAREVLEETAHRFEPTALVGIYRWRDPRKDVTFLRFCFRGNVGAAEKRPLDKEIVGAALADAGGDRQRRAEHRSPLVQKCVDDFLAGRNYPLDVFSQEFA